MKTRTELETTRTQIASFKTAIVAARAKGCPDETDPIIWKAYLEGLESMHATLVCEEAAMLSAEKTPNRITETP